MASMQELFQSMNMFSNSMQGLALNRAIQGANEEVNQIRMAEADEAQKLNQIRQVANNLAVHLYSTGTPASTVEGVTNSMTGGQSKAQPVQSAFQGLVAGLNPNNPEDAQRIREVSQKYIKEGADQKALLTQMGIQAKQGKEARQTLGSYKKSYINLSNKISESSKYARQALKALQSNNPAAIDAVTTMLAKASGEVGNLTETERGAFKGAQDLLSQIERQASRLLYSENIESDKKALIDLTQMYLQSAEESKYTLAETLTNQAGDGLLEDMDPNDLLGRISGRQFTTLKPKQQQPMNQAPAPGGSAPTVPGASWEQFIKQ